MELNEYQTEAHKTAKYPPESGLVYTALKLNGEAGEYAEKLGKILRDKNGHISPVDAEEMMKELGDVLWYVQECSFLLGFDFETVARKNLAKLADRAQRNALNGNGDNR